MSLLKTVNQFWENEAQPALMQYIQIPAKSTAYDRLWESHGYLDQCCELGKNWINKNIPEAAVEIIKEK